MLDHFSLFDWKSQVLEVFKAHVMFYGTKCPLAKSRETSIWLLFLFEIVIFIQKFMFTENVEIQHEKCVSQGSRNMWKGQSWPSIAPAAKEYEQGKLPGIGVAKLRMER